MIIFNLDALPNVPRSNTQTFINFCGSEEIPIIPNKVKIEVELQYYAQDD